MKEFNLEEAKAGKSVCTRDGNAVEILKFNMNSPTPIVTLIKSNCGTEFVQTYPNNGKVLNIDTADDLMMASEKQEGWMNIYSNDFNQDICGAEIWDSKEEAERDNEMDKGGYNRLATIHIEWEE